MAKLLGFDPKIHNIRTEIMAGLTSFLTMSYILAVNPAMFSILEGMPQAAVFTTTALVAVFSTLLSAFVARMPFGIAPGMGPNAFFVFSVPGYGSFMAVRSYGYPDRRVHTPAPDTDQTEGGYSERHP